VSEPITFIANPTQQQFIESNAQADLFAAKKGEGKSAALCWAILRHTRGNPGARWLFLRDTFENLRRTSMAEFFTWFPNGVYGTYHEGKKLWVWDHERTGIKGEIYFMGCDDETGASRIASMPLAGVAIDEPAGASSEGTDGVPEYVFDTAMGQLRQKGMKWYAAKLATNNPDESHWTYRRFVDPGTPPDPSIPKLPDQESGYRIHQTRGAENLDNLPPGYYQNLARQWAHRPDLVRRFVKGEFGFQSKGKAVTPEWNDRMHLAEDLAPVRGVPMTLMWDGGSTPTCVISQITPLGDWLILQSFVGQDTGMYELIRDVVKPILNSRYTGLAYRHTGDPNLKSPEQSSKGTTAEKVIRKELGGVFTPGPINIPSRVEPLREVLRRTRDGRGVVLVDKKLARHVWHALRGGWHYHVTRAGTVGQISKDEHSHPGDCMGYGAALLFPMGRPKDDRHAPVKSRAASYFNSAPHPGTSLGMARPGARLPKQARTIGNSGEQRGD
jgi:hypothetical protein